MHGQAAFVGVVMLSSTVSFVIVFDGCEAQRTVWLVE
jgi:hypothetical protein